MACLYLVPNTLDLGCEPIELLQVLPAGVVERASLLRHWIVEDAKSARAFLKRVQALRPLAAPLQELNLHELPRDQLKGQRREPASGESIRALLEPLSAGQDVGLLSEAGLPAVADPGHLVVAAAHAGGFRVEALSGPNAIVLALAASGLHGQSFAFLGYLPQDAAARGARLRELERRSRAECQTQLFIETPYRNEALMRAMLETLSPDTRVSVSSGLTLPQGWSRTHTVRQWRGAPPTFERHIPAVFALLAP